MTCITIVRNDKNFVLEFTIYDADSVIVDLTGVSSIKLKYKSYSNGTVTSITGTVIEPSTSGKAQFIIGEQFVGITGEFKAEIEITYLSGQVLTAPNLTIEVIPDIV